MRLFFPALEIELYKTKKNKIKKIGKQIYRCQRRNKQKQRRQEEREGEERRTV